MLLLPSETRGLTYPTVRPANSTDTVQAPINPMIKSTSIWSWQLMSHHPSSMYICGSNTWEQSVTFCHVAEGKIMLILHKVNSSCAQDGRSPFPLSRVKHFEPRMWTGKPVHMYFSLTVDLNLKLLQRHAKENDNFHPPGSQPWIQLKRGETVNGVSQFKACGKCHRRQMKNFRWMSWIHSLIQTDLLLLRDISITLPSFQVSLISPSLLYAETNSKVN